jgi:hypothetical protein
MATTTEDDRYHGTRIPTGTILIPNHWGMCFKYDCLFHPHLCFSSLFFLSNILQNANAVRSQKTYGQKYDPRLFEPRRWIDRPGGVGEIWEGHAASGFGRRYVSSFLSRLIYLCSGHFLSIFHLLQSIN